MKAHGERLGVAPHSSHSCRRLSAAGGGAASSRELGSPWDYRGRLPGTQTEGPGSRAGRGHFPAYRPPRREAGSPTAFWRWWWRRRAWAVDVSLARRRCGEELGVPGKGRKRSSSLACTGGSEPRCAEARRPRVLSCLPLERGWPASPGKQLFSHTGRLAGSTELRGGAEVCRPGWWAIRDLPATGEGTASQPPVLILAPLGVQVPPGTPIYSPTTPWLSVLLVCPFLFYFSVGVSLIYSVCPAISPLRALGFTRRWGVESTNRGYPEARG